MEKSKILLVTNYAMSQQIVSDVFKEEYDLLLIEDPEHILEKLETEKNILAILLDIHEYDNLKSLKILNQEDLNIPIFVISQFIDEESEIQAIKDGAWDFIAKPINPQVLYWRVKRQIKNAAQTPQKRYDALTGFYTQAIFSEKTQAILKQNPQNSYIMASFNIERFKFINDLFGVEAGDQVLVQLATLLKNKFKGEAILGRFEADHFMVCFPKAHLSTKGLLHFSDLVYEAAQNKIQLMVHVGLFEIKDQNLTVQKICDRARMALDQACEDGRYRFSWYSKQQQEKDIRAYLMMGEMEKGIKEKQFYFVLQPIYDSYSETIVSAEALARWNHPKQGILMPSEFIPIFEENGLIFQLDAFIREEVVKFQKTLIETDQKVLPISVNISRLELKEAKFVEEIIQLIKRYDVPAHLLKLEITESALTDIDEEIIGKILQLKAVGFQILLDDFGSGYSALNVLKNMPVDFLKMDMRFLDDFENSEKARSIIAGIAHIAKWLKLPVISEGVETVEQKEFLKSVGCEYIQGFFYSKGVSPEKFQNLLTETLSIKTDCNQTFNMDGLNRIWQNNVEYNEALEPLIGGIAFLEFTEEHLEILRHNQTFYQMMQLDRAEEQCDFLLQLSYKNQIQLMQKCREAERNHQIEQLTFQWQDRQGNLKWLQINIKFIGKLTFDAVLCVVIHDVSEKEQLQKRAVDVAQDVKQLQIELLWRKQQSQMIFKDLDIWIIHYDYKTDYMECIHPHTGKEKNSQHFLSEALGKDQMIHPDYAKVIKQKFIDCRHQENEETLDFLCKTKNDYQWYQMHYDCVEDNDGKDCHLVGRIQNAHQKKQASLAEKEAVFERYLDYDPIIFAVKFNKMLNQILPFYIQPEAKHQFYALNYYIGQNINLSFIHEEDLKHYFAIMNHEAMTDAFLNGNGILKLKYRIRNKLGEWKPVELAIHIIEGAGDQSLVGYIIIREVPMYLRNVRNSI